MVFFACNSCGSSLKKNQVDKHAFQCRVSSVSCMDCQKDFSMKDYGAHNKCISEVEKYSATGWKAPSNFNKGEKKQQAWVDTVNDTLKKHASTLTPKCRSLLQTIAKHDNVPRKKPKFMNFIKNVTKNNFDNGTVEQVWNMVDEEWKAQAAAMKAENDSKDKGQEKKEKSDAKEKTDESKEAENGEDETASAETDSKLSKREKKEARRQKQHKEEKKNKSKKTSVSEEDDNAKENGDSTNGHEENGNCDDSGETRKKESKKERKKRKRLESGNEITEMKKIKGHEEDDAPDENKETETQDAEDDNQMSGQDFKWGAVIREVLEKQPNHEIQMKKLQKKVFAQYYAVVGDSKGAKTKEELISKLNKKLKKSQFKIFKENVKLVE